MNIVISSKSFIKNGDNNYDDSEVTVMIIIIMIIVIMMIIIMIIIKDVDKIFVNAYNIYLT